MPDPAEQAAAAEMAAANLKDKELLFSILRTIERATPEDLIPMGYRGKTPAEAMQLAFRRTAARIAKREADFFKRFPD